MRKHISPAYVKQGCAGARSVRICWRGPPRSGLFYGTNYCTAYCRSGRREPADGVPRGLCPIFACRNVSSGNPASYPGRLKLFADCVRDALILMCVTDETSWTLQAIHLSKIVSNTHPSATHAAPRMSQMTRMAN